jgi:hypothetical protein
MSVARSGRLFGPSAAQGCLCTHGTPYPIQFGSANWITVVTNVTGTFTEEMTLPDGDVIAPTGKAFDLEFAQTTKWDSDRLVWISAF